MVGYGAGDGTATMRALYATLSQLGYHVLAPDDLGLGLSDAAHQAYMLHDDVAAVSLSMLRAVRCELLASGVAVGRQLHAMGGSHGGYETAAIQRRVQAEAGWLGLGLVGSFMHAPPFDASGTMLDLLTARGNFLIFGQD